MVRAKHLTTGKSIGIDIWSSKDLSDNSITKTLANAELEGVIDKIEIRNEDARSLTFGGFLIKWLNHIWV